MALGSGLAAAPQPASSSASGGLSQVSGSQCRTCIINILCLDYCLDIYITAFDRLKR